MTYSSIFRGVSVNIIYPDTSQTRSALVRRDPLAKDAALCERDADFRSSFRSDPKRHHTGYTTAYQRGANPATLGPYPQHRSRQHFLRAWRRLHLAQLYQQLALCPNLHDV